MCQKNSYQFSADRPIEKVEDDLLGMAGFAKAVAGAISGWRAKDSLVVALHGDWGSGKSSVKNMVVSELGKLSADERPDVVEFLPWEWAAQNKITSAFFTEISAAIGRADKSKKGKKLAYSMKKYGIILNAGENLSKGFSYLLFAMLSAAVMVGHIDSDWATVFSLALLMLCLVATVFKVSGIIFHSLSSCIDAMTKEKELSLHQVRKELHDLLDKRRSPLLIVIDDIDRLTPEQVRMVFQLVKANSQFPNVVFLLLFQRDLVEDMLSEGNLNGKDYLEKIIQVPFDMPAISTERMHDLLLYKINGIFRQNASAIKMIDQNNRRWYDMSESISRYFENLRDVHRFISTLSFHFSLFQERESLEVNPLDLLAIECLRVFEPGVYKEITKSKDVLTIHRDGNKSVNNVRQCIDKIIAKSTEDRKEHTKKLLLKLFSVANSASSGAATHGLVTDIPPNKGLEEMQICHHSHFDKYFQFSISSGQQSE